MESNRRVGQRQGKEEEEGDKVRCHHQGANQVRPLNIGVSGASCIFSSTNTVKVTTLNVSNNASTLASTSMKKLPMSASSATMLTTMLTTMASVLTTTTTIAANILSSYYLTIMLSNQVAPATIPPPAPIPSNLTASLSFIERGKHGLTRKKEAKEWDEAKKKKTKSGVTNEEPIKQSPSTSESVELVAHPVGPTLSK